MTRQPRPLASVAKYGGIHEFRQRMAVEDVDSVSDTGLPVLLSALGNKDRDVRMAMLEELLAAGVDASAVSRPEGMGAFHILFGTPRVDVADRVELLPRLIAAGSDINLRDDRGWRPIALLAKSRFHDGQLAPLYDAIFALDGLVLTEPANEWDESVLAHARKLRQRADLAERVEAYLSRRGVEVPPAG